MALPAALSALRFVLLHQCAAQPSDGPAAALAGGAYGDGPLWAAAAAVELLGLRRCYRRLDMASYLAHWQRYNVVHAEGRAAEMAAAEEALRREEDAAAEEDGAVARAVAAARAARTAAAEDSAAAAAMVAADARAARVWELARLAVGAQAAPQAPGEPAGGGAVSMAALGAAAPLVVGQDPDPLARLPACRAPMLFADAPSRFSSAAADAERRRAVALKRPSAAPAKAGLVDASRAARAVARFLEVAPPSAYSQSVREARSEVVSQIGSVGGSTAMRRCARERTAEDRAASLLFGRISCGALALKIPLHAPFGACSPTGQPMYEGHLLHPTLAPANPIFNPGHRPPRVLPVTSSRATSATSCRQAC
jgi:hypothetical protein